jgi:hypothetical protein
LIHHYLQRGIKPEDVINLPPTAKQFYAASMLLFFEEESEKWKAVSGSG